MDPGKLLSSHSRVPGGEFSITWVWPVPSPPLGLTLLSSKRGLPHCVHACDPRVDPPGWHPLCSVSVSGISRAAPAPLPTPPHPPRNTGLRTFRDWHALELTPSLHPVLLSPEQDFVPATPAAHPLHQPLLSLTRCFEDSTLRGANPLELSPSVPILILLIWPGRGGGQRGELFPFPFFWLPCALFQVYCCTTHFFHSPAFLDIRFFFFLKPALIF